MYIDEDYVRWIRLDHPELNKNLPIMMPSNPVVICYSQSWESYFMKVICDWVFQKPI